MNVGNTRNGGITNVEILATEGITSIRNIRNKGITDVGNVRNCGNARMLEILGMVETLGTKAWMLEMLGMEETAEGITVVGNVENEESQMLDQGIEGITSSGQRDQRDHE